MKEKPLGEVWKDAFDHPGEKFPIGRTVAMSDPAAAIAEAQWAAAKSGILSMWTVYDRPKDHPDGYVVRRFACTAQGPVATADAYTGSLELIRDSLWKAGLIKMDRQPDDEPQIVETWL
jgi:hypothetical protein